MKTQLNRIAGATTLALLLALSACTDLEEKTYSQVQANTFYRNKDEVIAAFLRPFGHMCGTFFGAPWLINELSTEEAAWPQKGRHGYDNGDWQRLHRHTWTTEEGQTNGAWNGYYYGVGLCNRFLQDLDGIDFKALAIPLDKDQIAAETRVMRAWFYFWLLNDFGNVPIVEKVAEPVNPPQATRKEVFEYIEKELKDNQAKLLKKGDTGWYGRWTQEGVDALLARLYLNAEVYSGTARWDDCIAAADRIINGGKYSLDATWQGPFKLGNESSNENIFVIAYDEKLAGGFGPHQRQLHYQMQKKYNLEGQPYNGIVTEKSFYDLYAKNDKRIEQWLVGPQFASDGKTPLVGTEEFRDQPLVIVPEVTGIATSNEREGVRNVKYEIRLGALNNLSNDMVMLRYADVLMMKAESLFRKGQEPAARVLVNQVRRRSFATEKDADIGVLTAQKLLDERGREFAYELVRRMDLIRFGKFTDAWWDKPASQPFRNLFPIPQAQINANPSLKQNPGY